MPLLASQAVSGVRRRRTRGDVLPCYRNGKMSQLTRTNTHSTPQTSRLQQGRHEVGCGINDAHEDGIATAFGSNNFNETCYSNDPCSVLMKVNGCDKERGQVHQRPLRMRSTDRIGP